MGCSFDADMCAVLEDSGKVRVVVSVCSTPIKAAPAKLLSDERAPSSPWISSDFVSYLHCYLMVNNDRLCFDESQYEFVDICGWSQYFKRLAAKEKCRRGSEGPHCSGVFRSIRCPLPKGAKELLQL